MKIKAWQINPARDKNNVRFLSLKRAQEINQGEIDKSIYDEVFSGEVDCKDLEEVYVLCNLDWPEGYRGKSMSCSDLIEVIKDGESEHWYCDSIGFQRIEPRRGEE